MPERRNGQTTLAVILQALWWLCRAGAAWKLLPEIYPPRQTIGGRLERCARLGVLERALAVPNGCLRLARGRKWRPSAGILATQSMRTGPQRGPRVYDAGKKVKGPKRVLLVDTEGLVHAIQVLPASVQDRDTPAVIEPELAGSSLLKVWADLAFAGDAAAAPMIRCGIDLELVGRKDKTGFEVEPKRWRIEEIFGVLGRYRLYLSVPKRAARGALGSGREPVFPWGERARSRARRPVRARALEPEQSLGRPRASGLTPSEWSTRHVGFGREGGPLDGAQEEAQP